MPGSTPRYSAAHKKTSGSGFERLIFVPSDTASKKPSSPICFRICFVFFVNKVVSIAENTTFSSFVLQGAENAASANSHSIEVRYVRTGDSFRKQLEGFADEVDGFIVLGTDITRESEPEIREFLEFCAAKPVVIDYENGVFTVK